MNADDVYKGKYLKASDFPSPRKVTITLVEVQEFDDGKQKPIIAFAELDRPMVVNTTNWDILKACLGRETDAWTGKAIVVFKEKVKYQGKLTDGLRVRLPNPIHRPAPAPAPVAEAGTDEVPF